MAAFQPLAIFQDQKALVVTQIDAARARRGDHGFVGVGDGDENVFALQIADLVFFDEKHPLQGQSPYSASKIGADKMAESFHLSFDTPVVTVRPFNTFGPRQSARAVIPTILSQILTRDEVKLGSLTPTRDLNYVDNTVEGYLAAGSHPAAIGRTISFGSGVEISIADLAALIARIVGKDVPIREDDQRLRPSKSEVERLLADNTLAHKILGWSPTTDLETGLTRTIEWFRNNTHLYEADKYNI